jgi:hypothetical protein
MFDRFQKAQVGWSLSADGMQPADCRSDVTRGQTSNTTILMTPNRARLANVNFVNPITGS